MIVLVCTVDDVLEALPVARQLGFSGLNSALVVLGDSETRLASYSHLTAPEHDMQVLLTPLRSTEATVALLQNADCVVVLWSRYSFEGSYEAWLQSAISETKPVFLLRLNQAEGEALPSLGLFRGEEPSIVRDTEHLLTLLNLDRTLRSHEILDGNFDTAFADEGEPPPPKRSWLGRLVDRVLGPSEEIYYDEDPLLLIDEEPGPGVTADYVEPLPDLTGARTLWNTEGINRGSPELDAHGEPVDCSVFAPKEPTRPREATFVQAWLYRPEQAEEAERQALQFDETAAKRGWTSLGTRLVVGDKVTLSLSFEGALEATSPPYEVVWEGRPCYASFTVTMGDEPGLAVGTLTVSQNSVPIGRISFGLRVAEGAPVKSQIPLAPSGEAKRFNKAFISYASQDRTEVLKRVQMLKTAGIGFFQDILDLQPGELWEKSLYHHIDEADVFLLFWSTAASHSDWVGREWHYALDHKGLEAILPVVIEGPPVPPPPAELAALHFNDGLLYFVQ